MSSLAPSQNTAPCVLVVDDDGHVCEMVSDILSEHGFETYCVTTDQLAYQRLVDSRYAALLVDINLGAGTTGYDVARFARKADPTLPVLYISGQTQPASLASFGVPGGQFVSKPFTPDELTQKLHALLGANQA